MSARKDAKWEVLKNARMFHGLKQVPPLNPRPNVPTYVARKAGVKSTQIDGVFVAGLPVGEAYVLEESRQKLGCDYEILGLTCCFRGRPVPMQAVRRGGPRRMRPSCRSSFLVLISKGCMT